MGKIDIKKAGELIRKTRELQNKSQTVMAEELHYIDYSMLSKIENGKVENEALCLKILRSLGTQEVDIPYLNSRLKVGFSQGFWAAPMIWINQESATSEFFKQVELTCYSDNKTGNLIFNNEGKRLEVFDKNKHSFFYLGEIEWLILNDKIDIGFLGNTVVEDVPNIVRIARLVNANSMRHAMIVIAPVGRFSNEEEVIDYLLKPAKPCYIYYHPNSTSEMEYRIILQHAGHDHDTLPVLNLPEFKEKFKEKVNDHRGSIVCQIGLMLSVDTAAAAVKDLDPQGKDFQVFSFRTTKIVEKAQELKKKGELEMDIVPFTNFYYEMVTKRDSKKIQEFAQSNEGFKLLLTLLREAVGKFDKIRTDKGIPLGHKKVANFFGLDKKETSRILKETEFELMFYPDWVNNALGIK
jgi:transcriptional regulator with XRE-family HTH domain